VSICPNCGAENPEGFTYCGACGRSLPTAERTDERRKTVSVVFADVVGSTGLGERLDPEALRRVQNRYFDEMQSVLEHHGGTSATRSWPFSGSPACMKTMPCALR
jgi:class 3 adenylate cyclase